jgi:hypothetical protein
VIIGVGDPLIGISIVNGSPALTRISFLPSGPNNALKSKDGFSKQKVSNDELLETGIIYLPFSGLAAIAIDESLGSPGPASLTALTRYSYSFKAVTFSSTKFVP